MKRRQSATSRGRGTPQRPPQLNISRNNKEELTQLDQLVDEFESQEKQGKHAQEKLLGISPGFAGGLGGLQSKTSLQYKDMDDAVHMQNRQSFNAMTADPDLGDNYLGGLRPTTSTLLGEIGGQSLSNILTSLKQPLDNKRLTRKQSQN